MILRQNGMQEKTKTEDDVDYTRLSDANIITARYMDSILIKQRLIDSVVAETSTEFFGEKFDMPIMTPAFSHLGCFNNREKT